MSQMKRDKEIRPTKLGKRKRLSLRSRTQNKGNACNILIVTEKGEELTYRIARRRRIYKIDKKSEVPYTNIKSASSLKVNSRIKLYGKNGVVNGIIKRITFLDPSTDVEPGDTPPIKRPGGH